MDKIGTTKFSPVLLRAFKKESELEVWKMKADGAYALLKTYPMCRWSGQLGPKRREGDRQVPEGFYYVTPRHMNPNSAYYLSFNIGYPNAFDKSHGRNGSHIMVHGACSSRGCFSMTDEQMAEIYAVVREAFSGGQKSVQLQSLPFRMTPKNLAKHRLDKNIAFWKKLKEGADHFDVSRREPTVMVCNRQYIFNARPKNGAGPTSASASCPPIERDDQLLAAVKKKQGEDEAKVAALIKQGARPVKIVYADGDQHPSFAHVTRVSRPEALVRGPVEIALDDRGRPIKVKPDAKTQVADLKPGDGRAAESRSTSVARQADISKPTLATTRVTEPKKDLPANATAFAPTNAPVVESSKAESSLVKRWFGTLGSFGRPKPEQPPTGAIEPADRKAETNRKDAVKRETRALVLPDLIRGAHAPLPAGLTAYAPLR